MDLVTGGHGFFTQTAIHIKSNGITTSYVKYVKNVFTYSGSAFSSKTSEKFQALCSKLGFLTFVVTIFFERRQMRSFGN